MEAGITIGRTKTTDFSPALFSTKPRLCFLSLSLKDFHWEEGEFLEEEYTIGPKCLIQW